tara:strand:- start:54 stop:1352 length:1299 start_codon:yes stop_codon:yes gene_type:complete
MLIHKKNMCKLKQELSNLVKNKLFDDEENQSNNINNYYQLIKRVKEIIKTIMEPHVLFVDFDSEDKLNKLTELVNCLGLKSEKCTNNCTFTFDMPNGMCKYMFPKKGFITGNENSKTYFNKLSDELIRYSYVYNFIFNRNYILTVDEGEYKVNNDEILIFDSQKEIYFKRTKTRRTNSLVENENIYDTQGNISIDSVIDYNKSICEDITINNSDVFKKFNKKFNIKPELLDSMEMSYSRFNNYPICSVRLLIQIINSLKNKTINIENLKRNIKMRTDNFLTYFKILDNLENNDKLTLQDLFKISKNKFAMKKKNLKLDVIIKNEEYYLTFFDFILLCLHYKVPCVIVSNNDIIENMESKIISVNSEEKNKSLVIFYEQGRGSPTYSILSNNNDKNNMQKNLVSNNNVISLLGNSDITLKSREELYRLLITAK